MIINELRKKGRKKIMEKKEFSKTNTLALKGIAIIMMIFHHCFRVETLFKGYDVSFFPFTKNFIVDVSATFKICVSIFAFITGYGLLNSLKKLKNDFNWSNKKITIWTLNRLIKVLSGFWIIAILSYIICQIINGRTQSIFFEEGILYGIIKIIVNFLGLSDLVGLNNFNSAWWYMSIAVLFILSAPIFAKLFKKYRYMPVLVIVAVIPRILRWSYVNSSYISFLYPFLLGMIFAEKNLMVKIANIKIKKNRYFNKILKFIMESAIIVLLLYIYNTLPQSKFWEIRYGLIPVLLICYLYEFFIDLPILKNVLIFLGKYSMDIFLIHEFIRTYYLNTWLYSFSNFIEIAIVLLLLSLIISIILELFKKLIKYDMFIGKLQNFVEKKILNF